MAFDPSFQRARSTGRPRDLEFKDVDGDNKNELLATISGEGSSTAGRFRIFEDASTDFSMRTLAPWRETIFGAHNGGDDDDPVMACGV